MAFAGRPAGLRPVRSYHQRRADRGAARCQRAMLRALPYRRLPVCPGRLVLSGERRRNFETGHARNSRCEHLRLRNGNRRAVNLRRRTWSSLRSLNEETLLTKPVHAALGGFRRGLEGLGRPHANGFAIQLRQPRDQGSSYFLGTGFFVTGRITHARSSYLKYGCGWFSARNQSQVRRRLWVATQWILPIR
jgi:hypothetical protein